MAHEPDAVAARASPSAVEIDLSHGQTLRGQRRGAGANWVILLHEPGTDLDAWGDLPARLGARAYTALALDLPGHGLSDDPWEPERLPAALVWAAGCLTVALASLMIHFIAVVAEAKNAGRAPRPAAAPTRNGRKHVPAAV